MAQTQTQPQAKDQAQTPPPGSKQNEPLKRDGSKLRRVKVWRMDENKHQPITVFVNSADNKKEFHPGQEVELSEQLIEALNDARLESMHEIPPNSGIYEADNPRHEAQAQNPGYSVQVDYATGTIYLVRSEPKYLVEYIR